MHGITAQDNSLTARQRQIGAAVSKAVPEFPTTVSDLISQLAMPDFSLATKKLELDMHDRACQNPRNQHIIRNIELALTAPSSECEPAIKAQIFSNATDLSQSRGYYRHFLKPYLVQIFDDLQDKGQQINMDGVVLTDLNLSYPWHLNLKGISAQGTRFHNIDMDRLNMEGGDFTGATFIDINMGRTNLSQTICTDATWSNVWFELTSASELTGNQAGICQRIDRLWQQTILTNVTIQVKITCLAGRLITATPDINTFRLPVPKLTAIQKRPVTVFKDSNSLACSLA